MEERNVYLIRHAESKSNQESVFGTDEPLSERGEQQALQLRDTMKELDVAIVVSSDTRRAMQTAFIAFPDQEMFFTDRRLREINFGINEGKPVTDDIVQELQADMAANYQKYKGDDMWQRAADTIVLIRRYLKYLDGNIAFVGHDTLYECIIYLLEYGGNLTESKEMFTLWSDDRRMKHCQVIEVPAVYFLTWGGLS